MIKPYAIALHGGAGTLDPELMSPEKLNEYRHSLNTCIRQGASVLEAGGTALDAVVETVKALEDDPLFNAGRGSVFTADETHELDASLMDGRNRAAGAVCAVKTIRNPILVCKGILNEGIRVLLAREGAEQWARLHGYEMVDNAYFSTEHRRAQLWEAKKSGQQFLDHALPGAKPMGTVGAVAQDRMGNLAAATSTGGMTNKQFGRVGDTPLPGCGSFADNETCAVSCTGHGEYFIRWMAAYDVAALMRYSKITLRDACREVIMNKLKHVGGEGGLIAIDAAGNIEFAFNSTGMYRASLREGEEPYVGVYRD